MSITARLHADPWLLSIIVTSEEKHILLEWICCSCTISLKNTTKPKSIPYFAWQRYSWLKLLFQCSCTISWKNIPNITLALATILSPPCRYPSPGCSQCSPPTKWMPAWAPLGCCNTYGSTPAWPCSWWSQFSSFLTRFHLFFILRCFCFNQCKCTHIFKQTPCPSWVIVNHWDIWNKTFTWVNLLKLYNQLNKKKAKPKSLAFFAWQRYSLLD